MPSASPINPAEQVEKIREILVGRDFEIVNERMENIENKVNVHSSEISRQVSEQMKRAEAQITDSQRNIQSITQHIRDQLQQESTTRSKQVQDLAAKIDAAAANMTETSQKLLNADDQRDAKITQKLETLSSEMASRIDAHSRQIMEHMHREIQQWKSRMDGQISSLTDAKVDRNELTTRLARIASAAMGDAVPPAVPNKPEPLQPNITPMSSAQSESFFATDPPSFASQPPASNSPQEDIPNFSNLDIYAMPTDPTDDFTS